MQIEITNQSIEIITPDNELLNIEKKLELCGRTCYKSEDKITEESAGKFVRSIVKSGHESVLEHASVTVKFICSRSTSHQLVRHRLAAYSQESQRYCIYKDQLTIIRPLWLAIYPGIYRESSNINNIFLSSIFKSYSSYLALLNNGFNREDAREVLPNACKTEVVTTFNMRQWRHVFEERALNRYAQRPIRELMQAVLVKLNSYCPNIFFDQIKFLKGDFSK